MVNDPGIVNGITDAAGALARAGITPAEQRAGLAELRGRLYDTVGRFAALPTADPGRSDAAFCLFLHVYASSAMRARPAWPAIAARFLEIAGPDGEPGLQAVGDNLLQAAGDITGQVGRAAGDAVQAAEGRAGTGQTGTRLPESGHQAAGPAGKVSRRSGASPQGLDGQ